MKHSLLGNKSGQGKAFKSLSVWATDPLSSDLTGTLSHSDALKITVH